MTWLHHVKKPVTDEEDYGYMIFTDGSITYARNGETGRIDYYDFEPMNAISYAIHANKGRVFIKNGVYNCALTFATANNEDVEIEGEALGAFDVFTRGTVLNFIGVSGSIFLDFRGSRNVTLSKIKIHNSSAVANLAGVRVGNSANDANKTKSVLWSDVVIEGFPTGLLGDVAAPDDSVFNQIRIGLCSTICIDQLSSQCTFIGGALYSSPIGVRVNKPLLAVKDTAMCFEGTTFSSCLLPIEIASEQLINQLDFNSCWFEGVSVMLLRVTNSTAGIAIGHIHFKNCNTDLTVATNTVMDLSGRSVWVLVEGGALYPNTNPSYIVTNGVGGTTQHVRLHQVIGRDRIRFNNSNDGLRGWDIGVLACIDSANPYAPGPVGGAYTTVWVDHHAPWERYEVVKCTAYFYWNPVSIAGKIRIWNNATAFALGTSEPAAAGGREDYIDCSANARLSGWADALSIQVADNGVNPVSLLVVWLRYEW